MKILNKIVNILKSKWLKDKGKTAILVAIIVAMFFGINAIVQSINPTDIDLTSTGLYRLTDETKEKIASLPEEDKIVIYMFDYEENGDYEDFIEFIKQYSKINKNISIELVSTSERPDLASQYNVEEGYGTIVITSGEKKRTLKYYDFSTYDYNTGDTIDITEQRITNSIIAVSSIGKTTPIYVLTGHDEVDMTQYMTSLKSSLELENYEIKTLDLLTAQSVPEDCEGLIIMSPGKDFTDLETKAIKGYIEKGGNILWFNDLYSAQGETPYINSILDLYGVTIRQDGLVIEQDSSRYVMGNPDCIIPNINYSEVTENVSGVLLIDSGKLSFVNDEALANLKVTKTDILTSSDTSIFRTNIALGVIPQVSAENGESESSNVLASILEKKVSDENAEEEKVSKLVIFANNFFATDSPVTVGESQYSAISFYNNMDLSINAVQYIAKIEDPITIRKTIETTYYTATEVQDRVVRTIIFTIPIIIIILGIVVWQLRRRKK